MAYIQCFPGTAALNQSTQAWMASSTALAAGNRDRCSGKYYGLGSFAGRAAIDRNGLWISSSRRRSSTRRLTAARRAPLAPLQSLSPPDFSHRVRFAVVKPQERDRAGVQLLLQHAARGVRLELTPVVGRPAAGSRMLRVLAGPGVPRHSPQSRRRGVQRSAARRRAGGAPGPVGGPEQPRTLPPFN